MKFFRIVLVIVFAALTGLYINLLGPVKNSTASTFPPVDGNDFTITAHENSCTPNMTQYGGSFHVYSKQNETWEVKIHRFFCSGTTNDCESNDNVKYDQVINFKAGQSYDFPVDTYSGAQYLACGNPGTYQADIEFVNFNSYQFQSAILCHTTAACMATPTPTKGITPTSIPTPTITITPTPTCTPRPACLDANPSCKIPEPAGGFCSTTPTPTPTPTQVTALCQFKPDTVAIDADKTGSTQLYWQTKNIGVGHQISICTKKNNDDFTFQLADAFDTPGQDHFNTIQFNGLVAPATYTAGLFITNTDDNSCSGSPVAICTVTTTVNNNTTGGCGDNINQNGGNNNANDNCNNNNNNNENNNSNSSNSNSSSNSNQSQSQTVNITYASFAPTGTQIQVQPAPQTTSLPNTGAPVEETLGLISMLPVGLILKRFAHLG